ncbi:E3 ubiquitin-protein ligase TRIM31-like [Strongylocentrotus purpuratus]|uniref:Uncharacterized protein n=1 Tax=Strongylocentrotus purpuratus TaxID=7668 RepID=A0A7M7GL81_STRPU|nr:E3 ubiquitin-protein ligase TRIM31-like [Strongylocentrotus purpuratus]|eukprot:XP_003731391.1 PREDICTED: E3 ubiquitin-protein ligase TRIM31-like [Strongylocentrotus purpuratus]
MASSSKQAFHKNLECPVCLRFFKDPKILTCSHTFCKGCLETLLELSRNKDLLLCPTCRGETLVPGRDVGRLLSNITVRSLVEDVETQGPSNQEDKCKKHTNQDEDCFCLNCQKYVCCKCAISEHVKNAHTILEAGDHEKNNIEELASKANTKIRNVDNYVTLVVDKRKRVHNVHEQLNDEIDDTFEESVQKLKKIRTVLKNEVGHKLGKIKTSLGDMEESGRKQIDQIKKARDLVRNGFHIPLQTEALTSHKAKCQKLEELLSQIGPDVELPRRTAEEGERIGFMSLGSDGLQLGQLRQKESKLVYREAPLSAGNTMDGMAISPNNEMAVGCKTGGIVLYSSEGIIQNTVLKSVQIYALHFMPDGRYVIRDSHNNIVLYTELCEKVDVTFETIDVAKGGCVGGLTVGKDGLIFVGYYKCKKIQLFKPEGGKALREITCNGFQTTQIFAMTSSQSIVVQSNSYKVQVINDVSGASIHSINKDGKRAFPAVCQDNSVIIAWVKRDQCLLSIVQYTKELNYIKNILTDFEISKPNRDWYYLRAFKTGEIAFCTSDRFYIFHETWE